ncbi:hypothetical protein Val02_72190 [Virgisporangium aliadipatigenens]|uniref:ESAT-6-like protein n=1 Tax=Virgisporangium aliadipatigenens TaxID=741659 RepID=A0A8J3YV80_9ACTN|nr:WXG100 family type VII secretion target [Virgisporangium aliadipatigenens]GIJ50333.1 hypothetical protein Val02_72190 [Virgisporangium aliadipatigenens]
MSDFTFDFNQADATLYDMNKINGDIKSTLHRMEIAVEKSLEQWTGEAREQYKISKKVWNAKATEMTAHLEAARVALLQISDNYGSNEQLAAKIWNDIRGG